MHSKEQRFRNYFLDMCGSSHAAHTDLSSLQAVCLLDMGRWLHITCIQLCRRGCIHCPTRLNYNATHPAQCTHRVSLMPKKFVFFSYVLFLQKSPFQLFACDKMIMMPSDPNSEPCFTFDFLENHMNMLIINISISYYSCLFF